MRKGSPSEKKKAHLPHRRSQYSSACPLSCSSDGATTFYFDHSNIVQAINKPFFFIMFDLQILYRRLFQFKKWLPTSMGFHCLTISFIHFLLGNTLTNTLAVWLFAYCQAPFLDFLLCRATVGKL